MVEMQFELKKQIKNINSEGIMSLCTVAKVRHERYLRERWVKL